MLIEQAEKYFSGTAQASCFCKTKQAIMDEQNWSERLEDLVAAGDIDKAIAFLEALVSKLEAGGEHSGGAGEVGLQLASALDDLAELYASKGFSLKSDELRSRSHLVKERARRSPSTSVLKNGVLDNSEQDCAASGGPPEKSAKTIGDDSPEASDDDWEAIVDRDPSDILNPANLPDISTVSIKEPQIQKPKRRGRGTFSYKSDELYCDRDVDKTASQHAEDHDQSHGSEKKAESQKSKYGTRHVLVLADFSPSMTTTDLERIFADFKDHGVVIRWVNDTTALAVFRTSIAALEACDRIRCTFTVRVLSEDDTLLDLISTKDLEPPCQRPKTSARTAQRMIAQSMGLKLPSSSFGSKELRNQEETRRNRIAARQKLRDDAWGDD